MSRPNKFRLQWKWFALFLLLAYPVMAIRYLPFGGGARYLSVLVGPLCFMLLLIRPREEWREGLRAAWCSVLPFVPFVIGWCVAQVFHGYDPLDLTPLSRVLLAALLFVGARIVGVRYWHLSCAAAVGAFAYGLIACVEVFILERDRAWGGVYENRFGQFAVWLGVLCVLHCQPLTMQRGATKRIWLLCTAFLAALFAILLSGSRGALLALPLAIAFSLARRLSLRQVFNVSFVVIVVCAGVLIASDSMRIRSVLGYQEFTQYFNEETFQGTSVGIRLELARVAVQTLSVKPWLGVGYSSLASLYQDYGQLLGEMPPSIASIPSFHSDWSQAIGIGGSLLLASLMVTILWLFYAARNDVYRTSFVVCALVFSISELFFLHKLGFSLLVATWALYAAAKD